MSSLLRRHINTSIDSGPKTCQFLLPVGGSVNFVLFEKSKNSYWGLQWWPKIYLEAYISHCCLTFVHVINVETTGSKGHTAVTFYSGIFEIFRMSLIFTDFPTGSESQPCAVLEICEYQGIPK